MSRSGYLAIQSIAIIDDQRRGAKDATKRARMRGFPLPPPDESGGVFHEMQCDLRQGSPTSVTHAFAPRTDGNLIRVGELRLAFHELNLAFIGPNPWSSKPAFLVPRGAWGRVIWNDKSGIEHIVNAGWFEAPPKRTIFRGLPTVERDLRRDIPHNAARI